MTGHVYRRYRFPKRTHRNQDLGPFVNHEMNRCIQCYRCVRFYRDYAGGRDLDVFGWHDHVYFGRHEDGVAGERVQRQPGRGLPDRRLHRQDAQAALHAQVGPADGALGLRALRAGLQHHPRRALRHAAAHPQPLQRRGQRLLPLRPRALRLRVRQQRRAASAQPLRARTRRRAAAPSTRARRARRAWPSCVRGGRVIGIGSPRASLEANFALRALVGRGQLLPAAWPARDAALLDADAGHAARGPGAQRRRCARWSRADAVLVLGEDVTNAAPMLALALRQAVRQQPHAPIASELQHPALGRRGRARGDPGGARARSSSPRRTRRELDDVARERLPRRAGRPRAAGLRRGPRDRPGGAGRDGPAGRAARRWRDASPQRLAERERPLVVSRHRAAAARR